MSKRKRRKNWKTKNLIIYMSLALFSFLVYAVVNYYVTIHIVGSERKVINQAILRQIISNAENNILEINNIADGIVKDSEYKSFAASPDGKISTFSVFRLQRRIQEEASKNHYINSVCLYAPKLNKVLTNLEYVSSEDYFDEEWLESCLTQTGFLHKRYVELGDDKKTLNLSIVRRFMVDSEKSPMVIININPVVFKEAFDLDGIDDLMNVLVTDKDNSILYETGDKQFFQEKTIFDYSGNDEIKDFSTMKIGNKMYDVYYRYSKGLDFKFFILVPRFLLMLKYYPIVYFMLIYIAIFLVVIYIALKRIESTALRPIDNFVNGISKYVDHNYNNSSYDNLEGLYRVIIENDQSVKKQISSSCLAMRWQLLMEILGGTNKSYDELLSQIKLLQMPMYPKNFVVMVVELEERKELLFAGYEGAVSVYIDIIFRETEKIGDDESVKSASVKMQDDNVVCIISFLDDDFEKNITNVMTYASILKSKVSAKIGKDISIGIGGYYVDFLNISDSYREAIIALEQKFLFGKGAIISIEDIRFPEDADIYGILGQIEMLKNVKIEKLTENVCDIFDSMVKNKISYETFHMFVIQIILAIFNNRNISDYKENIVTSDMYNDVYYYVDQFDVLQDAKDYIISLIEDIKMNIYLALKKDSSNNRIIDEVVNYIYENYANPELSLSVVSIEMGYNPSYISREFKKIKGINFIDYLIEFRINKAKELLLNTNERISNISTMVGYINANSFMRIFKRYTGVTPTEYRNNHAM